MEKKEKGKKFSGLTAIRLNLHYRKEPFKHVLMIWQPNKSAGDFFITGVFLYPLRIKLQGLFFLSAGFRPIMSVPPQSGQNMWI